LAAERADRAAGDVDRPIHEADLTDGRPDELPAVDAVETAVPDIRDVAIPDPREDDPRGRREVPPADTTADAVRRARESELELNARAELDKAREDEEAGLRQQQWLAAPEQGVEQAMVRERS
jgi:hypothetical protein